MKINIVGTSASGKSTFGRTLAEQLNVPFYEMDALFWKPDWTESDDNEFYLKLQNALANPAWVLDGNYTRTIPIKWKEVDTVIWLDYSFTRTLYQSVYRAVSRAISKKELWPNTGNVESFGRMFSSDSIILWCIRAHPKNRRKYNSAMNNPEYSHIKFVHLRSPRQARDYLVQSG